MTVLPGARWATVTTGLVVSGGLDVASTVAGLWAGFGESSPWAAALWAALGPVGLVLAKAAWVVWIAVGAAVFSRVGLVVAWFTVAVTAAAAVRNLLIVNGAGWLLW